MHLYSLDLAEPKHQYRNAAGKRLPGVTTILGVIAKQALYAWHNQQGLLGVDTKVSVKAAADLGKTVHARIEAYLRGGELDPACAPEFYEKSEPAFQRFVAWWLENDYQVIALEEKMVSEMWQVGGTLDILARHRPTGGTHILDIKTSKAVYPTHRIQVAGGYAPLVEECLGYPVAKCYIVRTGKDEVDDLEFALIEDRTGHEEAFTAARHLYGALKRIGGA